MKQGILKNTLIASMMVAGLLSAQTVMAAKDVTVAVEITFDSLDPYDTNSTLSQAVGKGYYESLLTFDKDLKIKPLLAEKIEPNADGTEYVLTLKEGVKFHDGTDFNAEAVKVNLERVLDKSNALARYNQFSRIESVEVLDTHKVSIKLSEPFSAFVNALAHPSAMMISPAALEKWGKDISLHPTGTGPFKFKEWKPSGTLSMEKFDGYWREGYPKIDSLTFKTVNDNNTRAAVLQTGEVDVAYPLPYEQVKRLQENDKLELVSAPSIIARYISMNVLHEPFDDVRVRKAVNYAINNEALAKVAYSGHAFPSQGVVPQGVAYAHKMDPWPYDPEKAKELLAEAGYADGFSTTLWSAYNDGTAAKAIQFLQQQLAQVGIKASVELLESGQRVERVQQAQDPEEAPVRMYYAGWSASTGEADWALRPLLATSGWPPVFNNTAYYSNDVVDENIEAALKTTDEDAKIQHYADAQEQIWEDAPWAFLVTVELVSAHAKKIKGFNVMPDGSFEFTDLDVVD